MMKADGGMVERYASPPCGVFNCLLTGSVQGPRHGDVNGKSVSKQGRAIGSLSFSVHALAYFRRRIYTVSSRR